MSNLTDTLSRLKEILIDQTAGTEAAQQSAALYHEIERAVQESVEQAQAQAQEIEARLEQARDLNMFAAREAQREPDPAPAQAGDGEL